MTPVCAICGGALTSSSSAEGLCARCLLTSAMTGDGDADASEARGGTSLAAGAIVGSLRIVRVLGRGGMATVYEARDERLDRAVALKVLPPEFLHDVTFADRFQQEARVVAALEHPNIVPIYASGIDQGIPWMSMRLLTGGTIGSLLEQGRPDAVRIVRLLRSVASALDHAHARGIVHRDVKPTNILLDGADGACVGDFGLAYVLELSSRMTPAGLLTGTPEYMAPEHALGKEADHRCDIYSLAIVAYEMFAGLPPFTADSPVALLLKHVNEALPEPPGHVVPAPVMRAIRRGAAKEPADRWPSATAFVDALETAIGTQEQRTGNRRMLWTGAVTAAMVAAAAGWLAIGGKDRDRQLDPSPILITAAPQASQPPATVSPFPQESVSLLPTPTPTPTTPAAAPERPVTKEEITSTALPSSATPVTAPLSRPIPPADSTATTDAAAPSVTIRDAASPGRAAVPLRDTFTGPVRIRTVSPKYPPAARAAQFEGDVLLEAVVSAEGKVTGVTIVRSVHPLLDDAARAAVLQYEYAPARRNGVPESAAVRLTVSFRMH
ncbi:MAG TPA: TonB family protein [Vicinamibacterales bacterium]|nr:TonB family protein [Vicinamibacterales bacterium]